MQSNCFDLFPQFLCPGAVFAKGISYRSYPDQFIRVFGCFHAFRVKVFNICAICVLCGSSFIKNESPGHPHASTSSPA